MKESDIEFKVESYRLNLNCGSGGGYTISVNGKLYLSERGKGGPLTSILFRYESVKGKKGRNPTLEIKAGSMLYTTNQEEKETLIRYVKTQLKSRVREWIRKAVLTECIVGN